LHETLDHGHSHAAGATPVAGGYRHRHAFVIDADHPTWPR
jgi:hypothetical protein